MLAGDHDVALAWPHGHGIDIPGLLNVQCMSHGEGVISHVDYIEEAENLASE